MNKIFNALLIFICMLSADYALSQISAPPDPCTTGSQNTCKCQNAPVLCSINALDGYEYDMTLFQHPSDGPVPMCPPPEGNGTSSNNPTWFAFIAWCSSLTFTVSYTNCLDLPGGGTTFGIQAAVYSGCPATSANAITCDTGIPGCVNNGLRILNVSGLSIGQVYYFLVDGCAGSACHIKINVVGNCSPNAPAIGPIKGDSIVYTNTAASYTYTIPKTIGLINYQWYIDGQSYASGLLLDSFDVDWSKIPPGKHTICVDGSFAPCFQEADAPPAACFDVLNLLSADTLTLSSKQNCIGQKVKIHVKGTKNIPGYDNYIFITDADSNIVQVSHDTLAFFTQNNPGKFTAYNLKYFVQSSPVFSIPTVGMKRKDVICGYYCAIDSITFSYNTPQNAQFVNPPPQSVALYCAEASLYQPGSLLVTNYDTLCLIRDTIFPIITGGYNACGGNVKYEWTYTDFLGRTINHTTNVLIIEADPPSFVNPPADVTITCDALPIPLSPLEYKNPGTATCFINGVVTPTVTGIAGICGGEQILTWTYTDDCGRTILHTQRITVLAIFQPHFIDPPSDITISCTDTIPPLKELLFTNNIKNACTIDGSVAPFVIDQYTPCNFGTIDYVWTYIDTCNRVIVHTQRITVNPTSVHELNAPNILLHPNPGGNQLTISIDGLTANYALEIYNAEGKRVIDIPLLRNSEEKINTQSLVPGFYKVILKSDQFTVQKTWVKQ
jgi:hypothetical protein